MFKHRPHLARVAIGLGSAAVVMVAALALTGKQAEAQGVMSAPACQCSAPTVIPSISTTIIHCLCGGMSCVITEHTGAGKKDNLLQCVK